MKIVAIIPARGGSKGVKRKNIKSLAGKPLIQYAIDAARASRYKMDLVVTTDDKEIAAIAKSFNVEVLWRAQHLADDKALMPPVVKDVLNQLITKNREYDVILLLQPTSPFRNGFHIDAAMKILESGETDSVISVTAVDDAHPARMYHIEHDRLQAFLPAHEKNNRQNLPSLYLRNGLIYALRTDLFLRELTFFIPNSTPIIVDRTTAVNIDDHFDFELAEFLMSRK